MTESIFFDQCRTCGRVRLRMRCARMGTDYCVLLDGGDRPHLGAVSLCGADGVCRDLSEPQHREALLASQIAQQIQSATKCVVSVLCGIHINEITPQEIQSVFDVSAALTKDLLAHINANKVR